MKSIYVGNIPFKSDEQEIKQLFQQYGTVHSVNFIPDRQTGRFRGFGFVEMDDKEALKAIEKLNGFQIGGRTLRINEAKGRKENNRRGPGGGSGGGGGRRMRGHGYDHNSGGRHQRNY